MAGGEGELQLASHPGILTSCLWKKFNEDSASGKRMGFCLAHSHAYCQHMPWVSILFPSLQVQIQHHRGYRCRSLVRLQPACLGIYWLAPSAEMFIESSLLFCTGILIYENIYFKVCRQDGNWLTTPEVLIEQEGLLRGFTAPVASFWQSKKLQLSENCQVATHGDLTSLT